jgi:hypothetical protein
MKLLYKCNRRKYKQLRGGITLKKIFLVTAFILLLLSGCQGAKNGTLDTSKLKKIEMADFTEEQAKIFPITYEAPSLKVGLDALPFAVNLPEKLPFDAKPFQPPVINDMSHEGNQLMVEFKTSSETDYEQQIILMITVFNSNDSLDTSNLEHIKLKNNLDAYYANKSVSFKQNGISYTIGYMNENIPREQHKKEIIEIANQMVN